MTPRSERGFTLVEVLVALAVIAIGLAALMTAVSGTASASGYLREKAQAQWIALNRLVEVRINLQKFGTSTDTGELDFANHHWHYDTRYYDTSIPTMRRVVVRVWAGTADTKSNPLAESVGFLGTAMTSPGLSNIVDWTTGSTAPVQPTGTAGANKTGVGTKGLAPGSIPTNGLGGGSAPLPDGGSTDSLGSDFGSSSSSGGDTDGGNTTAPGSDQPGGSQ